MKPTTDATLLEIARTVKTRNRTYVDVLAHTDTTGSPQGNAALSERRAAAVATYLAGHGVSRARIGSKGLGESAPLYNPETSETQQGRKSSHRNPAGALHGLKKRQDPHPTLSRRGRGL